MHLPAQPVEILTALRGEVPSSSWETTGGGPSPVGSVLCKLTKHAGGFGLSQIAGVSALLLRASTTHLFKSPVIRAHVQEAVDWGITAFIHSTRNSHWMRNRNNPGSGSPDTPWALSYDLVFPPVLSPWPRESDIPLCTVSQLQWESHPSSSPAASASHPISNPSLASRLKRSLSRWDVCTLNFLGKDGARTKMSHFIGNCYKQK